MLISPASLRLAGAVSCPGTVGDGTQASYESQRSDDAGPDSHRVTAGGLVMSRGQACAQAGLQRSWSTYTTRLPGAADWATSWVLFAVGMPVPISRNCRMPAAPARWLTARARKCRLARAPVATPG
jgi:hypothetical protein